MFKRVLIAFLCVFVISGICLSGLAINVIKQNYFRDCLLSVKSVEFRYLDSTHTYCSAWDAWADDSLQCTHFGLLSYLIQNKPSKIFRFFYTFNTLTNDLREFYTKLKSYCNGEECAHNFKCSAKADAANSLSTIFGVIENNPIVLQWITNYEKKIKQMQKELNYTPSAVVEEKDKEGFIKHHVMKHLIKELVSKSNFTSAKKQFEKIYSETWELFFMLGVPYEECDNIADSITVDYIATANRIKTQKEENINKK